jgi:plasmid maintenance system antidote protein VapI
VQDVRRAIQKALAEEEARRGLTQSDIARAIGVHRSVINREIRGYKDLTLGRVAELAWAMGRFPAVDLPQRNAADLNSPPASLTRSAMPVKASRVAPQADELGAGPQKGSARSKRAQAR